MPNQEFVDEMNKISKWVAELRSLGVESRRRNELNSEKELRDLTDNVKQSLYQEYKAAYS